MLQGILYIYSNMHLHIKTQLSESKLNTMAVKSSYVHHLKFNTM